MGARAFKLVTKYLDQLEGAIVEIGSERGEGSTSFFAGLMYSQSKFNFYTVDVNKKQFDEVDEYTELLPNVHAYHMKGVDFLRDIFPTLNKKICYAYLDNFDWCWSLDDGQPIEPRLQKEMDLYRSHGQELTHQNSQLAHLEQTQLLLPYVSDRCLIQFDDTWMHNWQFSGKGGLAVPWLIEQGWSPVVTDCRGMSILLSNFVVDKV